MTVSSEGAEYEEILELAVRAYSEAGLCLTIDGRMDAFAVQSRTMVYW